MYELWAKRRGEPDYIFIKKIEPVSIFYELDALSPSEFKEAMVVERINNILRFIHYEEYKKEKVLRK